MPQDQGPQPPPARETELRQGQEEHVIRLIAVNGRQIFKGAGRQTRRDTNGTFPLVPVRLDSARLYSLCNAIPLDGTRCYQSPHQKCGNFINPHFFLLVNVTFKATHLNLFFFFSFCNRFSFNRTSTGGCLLNCQRTTTNSGKIMKNSNKRAGQKQQFNFNGFSLCNGLARNRSHQIQCKCFPLYF